jgi:hypothetical protein
LAHFTVYNTVGVWFFITDRNSDGMRNYRR